MWHKLFPTANDPTLTVARIVLAAVFFAHGSQKMFGLFGGRGIQGTIEIFESTMALPAPLTFLVMFTEVFGALGLLLGLLSRVAALGVTPHRRPPGEGEALQLVGGDHRVQ